MFTFLIHTWVHHLPSPATHQTHLVEFHGVVGQVVVDVEVEPGSILRMVIPVALEAQDPPILGTLARHWARWGWFFRPSY